jgi:hypothetical protein
LSSRASVENALSTTTGAPERKERRLAIAGRRRDEHDRRVGRRYQALEQRRPIDDAWFSGAAGLLATMRRRSAAWPKGDARAAPRGSA